MIAFATSRSFDSPSRCLSSIPRLIAIDVEIHRVPALLVTSMKPTLPFALVAFISAFLPGYLVSGYEKRNYDEYEYFALEHDPSIGPHATLSRVLASFELELVERDRYARDWARAGVAQPDQGGDQGVSSHAGVLYT